MQKKNTDLRIVVTAPHLTSVILIFRMSTAYLQLVSPPGAEAESDALQFKDGRSNVRSTAKQLRTTKGTNDGAASPAERSHIESASPTNARERNVLAMYCGDDVRMHRLECSSTLATPS